MLTGGSVREVRHAGDLKMKVNTWHALCLCHSCTHVGLAIVMRTRTNIVNVLAPYLTLLFCIYITNNMQI